MVLLDRLFQHLLELFCRHLVRSAVFGDLLFQRLYQQFQLGRRHLYIRQLFDIFRAENVFLFAFLQNIFDLIVPQCFLHHFFHMAVHCMCINIAATAHLADKPRYSHKALRQRGFILAEFPGRLADVVGRTHTLDRFQEVGFERDLPNILSASPFGVQFFGGCKNILRRFRKKGVPLCRITSRVQERRQIITGKQVFQDFQLFPENIGSLLHVIFRRGHRIVPAIHFQCLEHIIADTNVIHDHAIFFAGILAVHTADGLNQKMFLERLIIVHVGKRRHIKTGNPHIYHNGNSEVGEILLECSIQFLGSLPVLHAAKVLIHFLFIVFANAGHHGHEGHGLQPAHFFFRYVYIARCFLLFKPFRIFFLELF